MSLFKGFIYSINNQLITKINVILFVISFIIENVNSENLYTKNFLLVNYTQISTTNSTVSVSETKNIAPCSCDITPNVCDAYCCCDIECSSELIQSWKDAEFNTCSNIPDKDYYSILDCSSLDEIYTFNSEISISNYKYPLRDIFCLMYDNSGVKGQFYRNILGMESSQLLSLYNNFINQEEKFYYKNLKTGIDYGVDAESYVQGDYVRGRVSTNFERDGKVSLYGANQYGQCTRNRPIKFLNENIKVSCGKRVDYFYQCANTNWKDQVLLNYVFSTFPSNTASTISVSINSILYKDYSTGKISTYKSANDTMELNDMLNTTLISYNSTIKTYQYYNNLNYTSFRTQYLTNVDNCTCSRVLSELQYTFVLDSTMTTITKVLADVVLLNNIPNSSCTSKKIFKQDHSSKYTTTVNGYKYSGSPGYITNNKLLVAKNITNSTGTYLSTSRNGFYLSGRDSNKKCFTTDNNALNSTYPFNNEENLLTFESDIEYTCFKQLTLVEFQDYCQNNRWAELKILEQIKNIEYIGKFGNANLEYFLVSNINVT